MRENYCHRCGSYTEIDDLTRLCVRCYRSWLDRTQRREMSMAVPDLAEVLAARRRIEPYLRPTPLYRYPALDATAGARVWVKHENHQPVGAFKVRGGVNLVSQLTEDERRRGVIAASTGNHGQSVAYAADGVRRPRRDLHAGTGQPGQGRVDAGARRRGGLPRCRLRRGP